MMKKHDIFYSLGILIIILSTAYYFISSSPGVLTPDGTVVNFTGEKGLIDSTVVVSDAVKTIFEEEKAEKRRLLWFTVPIGILLLGAGVRIKRKTEGPDLFIDRDEDDEDFSWRIAAEPQAQFLKFSVAFYTVLSNPNVSKFHKQQRHKPLRHSTIA